MGSRSYLGTLACALALVACGSSGDGNGGNGTPLAGSNGGGAGTNATAGNGGGAGTNATAGNGGGAGTMGEAGNDAPTAGTNGGTAGSPPPQDCSEAGPALPDGECKATAEGIYALKTVLDVWWHDETSEPGTPIIDPGRGTMTIYLMGELSNVCDDGHGRGVMRACGAELPPFTSDITCDAYQLEFPDEVWDAPDMPTFLTSGSTDGFDVGSTLSIAQVTGLVGIKFDGSFPTPDATSTFSCDGGAATGLGCFIDADGDGFHGITVRLRNGGMFQPSGCGLADGPFTYRGAPTSVDPAAAGGTGAGIRAVQVHVGLSTTLGGSGVIEAGCASGKGSANAPENAIQSRVASCKIDPASLGPLDQPHPNDECTGQEAQFVDENVPNYHVLQMGEAPPTSGLNWPLAHADGQLDPTPSPGPLSSVVRLGDLGESFTCADVRGAAFPEL